MVNDNECAFNILTINFLLFGFILNTSICVSLCGYVLVSMGVCPYRDLSDKDVRVSESGVIGICEPLPWMLELNQVV